MPDQKAYQKIAHLIEDLSSRHRSPRFEPHVTLLSGIHEAEAEAVAKLGRLAAELKPIEAGLTRIEYLELYYRCLFFRTDESQALMAARREAEQRFEHSQVEPFVPHISFLYGSLPLFAKQAIIQELGENYPRRLCLDRIRLVETGQTPDHWRSLAEFKL